MATKMEPKASEALLAMAHPWDADSAPKPSFFIMRVQLLDE